MSGPAAAARVLGATAVRLAAATRPVTAVPGWTGAAAAAAAGRAAQLRVAADWMADDLRTAATALAAAGAATSGRTGAAGPDPAADEHLASVLDAAGRAPAGLAGAAAGPGAAGGAPAGPPDPSSPAGVAAWWAGLDEPAREVLRRERPDLVGGLDGLPARERDRANRAVLTRTRTEAESERRAVLAGLIAAHGPADLARAGVLLAEVHERLARLQAVTTSLQGPGRALLAFDATRGHAVTAAVATGDVDTAANVAVLTPGFTADVRDLPGSLAELDAVARDAGPGTAAVAWYGYEAPQWSGLTDPRRSVASPAPADAGAPRLAGFLTGLDAAHGGPGGRSDVHLTAVGHSYGSLTAARAVARTPAVDDAVYLGSPGLGGPAPGPAGHTWVGEAAGDPVADLGWFGPDPNREPGVGGLSAAQGPGGTEASHGHSDYLRAGTTSERNVAAVVAGRPDAVVVDHGVGVGDRLRALLG